MKEYSIESKLTPAAREALDEFIQNYKDQVLRSATRAAGNITGEIREISVRDILEAINTIHIKGFDSRTRKRAWLLRTLTLSGIIYALLGIGLLMYEKSPSVLTQLPFSIVIGGLVITLFGYLLGYYLKVRPTVLLESPLKGNDEQQAKELSFVFLERWQTIELEARNMVSQKLGESRAKMPLSRLLDELIVRGVLDKDDNFNLRALLIKRNQIVHREVDLPKSELMSLIKQADRLLHRIRSATS